MKIIVLCNGNRVQTTISMLFPDLLQQAGEQLEPEFDRLFQLAVVNQHHSGDIILLHENGSYDANALHFKGAQLNPHVIGPGRIGWSYFTHYQFIDWYRQTHTAKITHAEWLAKIAELTQEKNWNKRDKFYEIEANTIHLETLIYLKVWESDYVIKILYEFVRILEGKPYDWYFKVKESARDKEGTDVRHEIIRKLIRNKIKNISPILYGFIKKSYLTQLRNSIAHSNFIFQSDYMQLGNDIADDPHSQLKAISFSEWADKFNATLMIYNGVIGTLNRAREYTHTLMQSQDNQAEVFITDTRPGKGTYTLAVVYDSDFRRFSYKH